MKCRSSGSQSPRGIAVWLLIRPKSNVRQANWISTTILAYNKRPPKASVPTCAKTVVIYNPLKSWKTSCWTKTQEFFRYLATSCENLSLINNVLWKIEASAGIRFCWFLRNDDCRVLVEFRFPGENSQSMEPGFARRVTAAAAAWGIVRTIGGLMRYLTMIHAVYLVFSRYTCWCCWKKYRFSGVHSSTGQERMDMQKFQLPTFIYCSQKSFLSNCGNRGIFLPLTTTWPRAYRRLENV